MCDRSGEKERETRRLKKEIRYLTGLPAAGPFLSSCGKTAAEPEAALPELPEITADHHPVPRSYSGRRFLRPFPALSDLWIRVKALVLSHAGKNFTGKIRTQSAVVQSASLAAGLYRAFAAPEGLFHVKAAPAAHSLLSGT